MLALAFRALLKQDSFIEIQPTGAVELRHMDKMLRTILECISDCPEEYIVSGCLPLLHSLDKTKSHWPCSNAQWSGHCSKVSPNDYTTTHFVSYIVGRCQLSKVLWLMGIW
jgi:hypothetical protein